jgi:hypothetical protein
MAPGADPMKIGVNVLTIIKLDWFSAMGNIRAKIIHIFLAKL